MIMAYGSTFAYLSVLAFDILSKATALLTVVLLVDLTLRQYPAALRHRVLTTAFFGLLVMPILSIVLPEYRIAILPTYRTEDEQAGASNILKTDSPESVPPVPSVVFPRSSEQVATLAPSQLRPDEQRVVPNELATPANQFSNVAEPPRLPLNGTDSGTAVSPAGISPLEILGAIWVFGIIATLSSFVLGIHKTSLLQRRSQRIDDQQLKNMLAELCRRLRIARSVTLIETEQAIVPMTWGLVRPFVLVPSAWRDWTQEQVRLVLLHELSHVKRLDVAYQAIARIACSLYWCHPLVWYALKRLRIEREIACDDCVLMAGARPSQYAEQLLNIARKCQWTEIPYAVSMAQPSQLENRVRSILDPTRSHLPLTPKVAGGTLAISMATLLLLSPIRLESLTLDLVEGKESANSKLEAETSEAEQLHISGVVTSPDNLPLANARVTVLRAIVASKFSEVHYEKLVETITDRHGRYEADVAAKSARISDGFHFEEQRTIVLASKSGYGPDQVEVTPSIGSQNLQLAASSKALKGRILDQEGKPLQGVKIKLVKIEKAGSSIESWLEQSKNNPDAWEDPRFTLVGIERLTDLPQPVLFPSNGPIEALDAIADTDAVSDSNGRFILTGVGDDRQATLRIESPNIATSLLHCITHDMTPVEMPSSDRRFRSGKTFGSEFDYVAEPSQWIQGVIRDKQTGAPLAGVVVSQYLSNDGFPSNENLNQVTTDTNGRYILKGIPKPMEGTSGYFLSVEPGPNQPYLRSRKRIPRTKDLDPIDLDFTLTSSIWIEGQVTNAQTNAPLAAMVAYHPSHENLNTKNHEAWQGVVPIMGTEDLISTDSQGRFRVVGLPGPGMLRVFAADDIEYELLEAKPPGMQRRLATYYHCSSFGAETKEFELAEGEKLHRVDVALKPPNMRSIRVVDGNGQDIIGYQMAGRYPEGHNGFSPGGRYWGRKPISTARTSCFPGVELEKQRPLMFLDPERKLGAIMPINSVLDGNEEDYRVTLLQTVKMKGRLLDQFGKPFAQGSVQAGIGLIQTRTITDIGNMVQGYSTRYNSFEHGALDKEGNFELIVPPGDGYCLVYRGSLIFRDRQLLPGETIDLGTIELGSLRKAVGSLVPLSH